ncbi:LysR family transcriptional regulator [Sporomusa termitida]|uniref:HTH-type transcriptional regulator GltC n=1 Tax=Sporomusa termitida TaxID=2377 RepID=A0A517DNQ4_9FIRM|nr:LysR family transcriptional regulator [Sporomusa termitida]QDR78938.1 HTH-type transcriptional regulator GltC [Sporomusa termitida]
MEWHQLEYFLTVAQLQHFTRAAGQLSISQPALSRSIARLEAELGVPLFERRGKNIRLNQFGKIFLQHISQAMQEIRAAKREIESIIHPDQGTVSLAFLHSQGAHIVPDLLGRFRAVHPNIRFRLYQNPSYLLLEQLEAGDIDLCLSTPPGSREDMEWTPLYTEELFVVVPADHRLAGRKSIALAAIAPEPIITLKSNFSLRILTDQLFREARLTPDITFEGEEIPTVAGLVEAGLGVAVIPRLPGLSNSRLAFLPISSPPCYRTIGLAWIKGRYAAPATLQFRDFVLSSFPANPDKR